jgi:hypothetical protein
VVARWCVGPRYVAPMEAIDSVVLLHDGPRLWLNEREDGLLRAFRRPLPVGLTLDSPDDDWERVFRFLPECISEQARACWSIAFVPIGSGGRPARIFSFDAELPTDLPVSVGQLGHVVEARLGRVNEYSGEGRVGDAETLIAMLAVAHDRIKNGGRGRGQ